MILRSIFILLMVVLAACAQESTPTGGIKDEIAPEPVMVTPGPMSLNFRGQQFEYLFDEYIQADEFSQQLLVSPPLTRVADYKLRGRKLTVFWDEQLLENTTYQFNLGQAVKDLNEGNVNDQLVYVFSTGGYIDSMSVSGKVYDAFSNAPVEKAKVLLYKQYQDSLPYTTAPDYLAITDKDGLFTAKYLSPDTFKLFVLQEESSNYKYDGPPERIGFVDYLVRAAYDDTTYSHVLALFEEADTSQYIKSGKGKDYGYYETVFNIPVENPLITFTDEENNEVLEAINLLNANGDTLKSWVSLLEKVALEEVTVITVDGKALADTTAWYIETDPKYREKAKLIVSASTSGGNIDGKKPVTLSFNNPLEMADTTLITLLEDSVEIHPSSMNMGTLMRKLDVHYLFAKNRSYTLVANAGAFKDIYGNYSDSLGFIFGLRPDDYYGSLIVKVMLNDSLDNPNLIVHLKKGTEQIVKSFTISETGVLDFGKLIPGKYTLTGIFDENGDGKWTTGNYTLNRQPERQVFYVGELDIRSNWVVDIDWIPGTPFDTP